MALDMRTGDPTKLMLKFTLPMFIGNLFQQLYTMVDSIVVGRFDDHRFKYWKFNSHITPLRC